MSDWARLLNPLWLEYVIHLLKPFDKFVGWHKAHSEGKFIAIYHTSFVVSVERAKHQIAKISFPRFFPVRCNYEVSFAN